MKKDYNYLLDLHDYHFAAGPEGCGFACVIRAEREVDQRVSYGIVLMDKYGNRVLGFDNSHGHDHEHPPRKGRPYNYTTAEQLIADFFDRVDSYFKGGK